jgi:hypothetical protein
VNACSIAAIPKAIFLDAMNDEARMLNSRACARILHLLPSYINHATLALMAYNIVKA